MASDLMLRRQNRRLRRALRDLLSTSEDVAAALNELGELRARVAGLEAALREFIAYAKNLEPDEAVVTIHRRAAKALGGLEGVPTIDHSARGRGAQ